MNRDEMKNYKEDLWELEQKFRSRRKFETIFKLYAVFGALTAIFALAYFILSMLNIELTKNQILSLMIAGVGVSLSMISWALLLFRRQREYEETKRIRAIQTLSEIVFLWTEFENVGKQALSELNVKYNSHSARQMMNGLEKYELIDSKDLLIMEEAMQIRNAVAHGQVDLAPELIQRVASSIISVTEKISTNRQRQADA